MDIRQKKKEYEYQLKNEPKNARLWLEYGDFISEEFIEPELALDAYLKVQELLPNKDIRLKIGYAYFEMGNTRQAIELIEQSIVSKPRPEAYCILADILLRSDENHKARQACLSALSIDPDYEEAYYLLGESWLNESLKHAIKYYKKAIKIDPEYSLAYRAIGQIYVKDLSTRKKGISFLKKAIKFNKDDGWAYVFLAYAHWKEGSLINADRYYQTALQKFPNFPEVYKWYSDFLFSIGKNTIAQKIYDKYLHKT